MNDSSEDTLGDGYQMGYEHGREEALESFETAALVAQKLGVSRADLRGMDEAKVLEALEQVQPDDKAAQRWRRHEGRLLLRDTGARIKGQEWRDRYGEGYAAGQVDAEEAAED